MELPSYLQRIGFIGAARPDLATLRRIQRGHLTHIPYENLDVQLGRRLTLSPEAAFDKLVTRRRGGWCYEMNGLLKWALETIGFDVLPMTGAVERAENGDRTIGNHLALRVRLDRDYIVDTGLGDGPSAPIPLETGSHREAWRDLSVAQIEDGWWRFTNYTDSFASSFDFRHEPADWDVLHAKCAWLQSDPDSTFVQNTVCLRPTDSGFIVLLGRVLKTVGANGVIDKVIDSPEEHRDVLVKMFGLDVPEARTLWPAILQRHRALFGD
jgi:N-hydroxyarylamine O-acetyltransferase